MISAFDYERTLQAKSLARMSNSLTSSDAGKMMFFLPPHIPSNLSVFEERKKTNADNWDVACAIWIRKWYGNGASPDEHLVEETVTRASADEAYLRLWRKALWPPQHNYEFDGDLFCPKIFDDNATAYGVPARDTDDEVELMAYHLLS
ncbi:hypothetical protein G6011_00320 [Alternaria panax]|uniref:Uncharacterized protein n=1 Tax=Alternaria panax TaxID=48097 RepID=A0AAD4IIN7_9PLEO|nr:hypothetical protein G6011_00320 [Alternaria panax]